MIGDWVKRTFPKGGVLPYDGSSGFSGSETSRERAERQDATGVTSERQKAVLRALDNAGERGATWKEIGDAFGWHHGQASGVLSGLHKAGLITRITERRQRCQVYVLPFYLADREQAPYKRNKRTVPCTNCGHEVIV